MELFSRLFVQAIANQAGLSCEAIRWDFGVDLVLREIRLRNHVYEDIALPIEIQLKSTTVAKVNDGQVIFDLDAKSYRLLRETNVTQRRILILVHFPEVGELFEETSEGILLRGAAYWYSLVGLPESDNVSSVRVRIPLANRFTVVSLRSLIEEFPWKPR